jgi:hypothetical protein
MTNFRIAYWQRGLLCLFVSVLLGTPVGAWAQKMAVVDAETLVREMSRELKIPTRTREDFYRISEKMEQAHPLPPGTRSNPEERYRLLAAKQREILRFYSKQLFNALSEALQDLKAAEKVSVLLNSTTFDFEEVVTTSEISDGRAVVPAEKPDEEVAARQDFFHQRAFFANSEIQNLTESVRKVVKKKLTATTMVPYHQ